MATVKATEPVALVMFTVCDDAAAPAATLKVTDAGATVRAWGGPTVSVTGIVMGLPAAPETVTTTLPLYVP